MRFLIMAIACIFLLIFPQQISATENKLPADIIFINQVRGVECCDKGNINILKSQINEFINNQIPAYFALRYDVLTNPVYLEYLKTVTTNNSSLIKFGLLLEITPQLANDSQIKYHGSEDKWYEAQNIYSIGYSYEENKIIMDLLFTKFHQEFGYYPELTSAWMIETKTLNYIQEKYQVKIHQITKEQWQTDSYTLYGGPPHYPYPASANWAFIPDFERKNAVLIVRQTIADPLKNYGDATTSFTSQPNDYMRDKKTFEYFKALINEAIKQPQKGFALLGLENSMEDQFNNEYLKQIAYVKMLAGSQQIIFPDLGQLVDYWSKQKVTVFQGKDLTGSSTDIAYWITAPQYRARLRINKGGFALTDLRIFDTNYIDPYSNYLAIKQGFWVIPYIIDGSHGYFKNERINPLVDNIVFDVKNDKDLNITSIKFPSLGNKDIKPKIIVDNKNNSINFSYQGIKIKNIQLLFQTKNFSINYPAVNDVLYIGHNQKINPIKFQKKANGFSLNWLLENKPSHSLAFSCEKNSCKFLLSSDPKLITDARIKQYPYLFPEPVNRELSIKNTAVIVHNQYAIANRNPVRLIVIPKDKYSFPIKINEPIELVSNKAINYSVNNQGLLQYVDINNKEPASFNLLIKVNGKSIENANVFFAPNCKQNVKYCLTHPVQSIWYINSVVGDKYRQVFLNEKQ